MRNSFFGLCIALVIALLIGCAHPQRHVKRPAKPHVHAVWIPGHYASAGKWIPGHWRR